MIHFISDTHFDHKKIIDLANRPFNSIEEMNERIIENWNKKVKSVDEVYHLGDFGFGNKCKTAEFVNKLNGRIYLIKGNHDKFNIEQKKNFEWIKDYYKLRVQNLRFVLFHYPIYSWDGQRRETIHLHGHVHKGEHRDSFEHPLKINMGVDVNNFGPLSIDEIMAKVKI